MNANSSNGGKGEGTAAGSSRATERRDDAAIPAAPPDLDLQVLMDTLPFYVMLVDDEHNILFANKAVTTTLGVDHQDILGGYCPKVVHGLDGPYPGCPLEEAVEKGHDVECDLFDERIGRIFKSAVYLTPYKTSQGRPIYLHTTRDITEQRAAEANLARTYQTQHLLTRLLQISLEPISFDETLSRVVQLVASAPWLSFEPQGAVFVFDEASDTLFLRGQHGLDERVRLSCERVASGECVCGRAAESKEIQYVHCEDTIHTRRFPGMPPHGHYSVPILQGEAVLGVLTLYVSPEHMPAPVERDFLLAVAGVLGGIIRRERAEVLQREHQRIALSRERMARMGEIAAGVAHTVRNPLHGVLNCVALLEAHVADDDPKTDTMLTMLREGMSRIEKVTRRLLMLTREEDVHRKPTRASEVISDVQTLTTRFAEDEGVELTFECTCDCVLQLDADRLVEGLTNIVGNALDACAPGARVDVRARCSDERDGGLEISVTDTGCGIPERHLARVLDPFFSTKPIGEGTGLGLAIARQVAEQHGGSIDVQSHEGKGTTVTLVFPNPDRSRRAKTEPRP